MSEELKRFCYQNKCPKCGQMEAEAKYECLHDVIWRKCTRCGYAWRELPLDAQPEEGKE